MYKLARNLSKPVNTVVQESQIEWTNTVWKDNKFSQTSKNTIADLHNYIDTKVKTQT